MLPSVSEEQQSAGRERNYGIDLLRLVLMFMVCILHTLGQGGIIWSVDIGTKEYNVYWLLEILSYCAVNGFALISGYTASNRPRKYEKLVDMWFQAFFYSFVITAVLAVAGLYGTWTIREMVTCALPVTFQKFWYFTAYVGLFFATPVLNRFLFSLEIEQAKKALVTIVILCSVLGILSDPFTLNKGYSALWLMVLYSIGVLAKKIRLFESSRTITLILLWLFCMILTWGIFVLAQNNRLVNYVSPTILLSGILMVILFSRIRLKGRIVSKLSPLAFGIYLFQLNPYVWNHILPGAFAGILEKPLLVGVPLVLAAALAIFASGLFIEFLRSVLAKLFHISKLSRLIAKKTDSFINRLCAFLK